MTALNTDHVATSGPTLTSKYGNRLGHTGKIRIPPPERLFGMCVSRYNQGKSHFFQSCPDAYIWNTDQSSVLQPDAVVWPVLDTETGRLMDADGKPMILTYEAILEKKKVLLEMAVKQEPRPAMVVIDSLTSFLRLLKDYCVRNARALGLKNDDVLNFKGLDGRAAYDWMYDQMMVLAQDLRNHGYGFYYVAHIKKERRAIKMGDDIVYAEDFEVSFTKAVAERLYPMMEMVFEIQKRRGSEEFVEEKIVQTSNGPTKIKQKGSRPTETFHLLTRNDTLPDGTLKPRIKMPDTLQLPAEHAWAFFASEYAKYAQRS